MLQVNITQLVAAVQEAAPFTLPEMNEGMSYLYRKIYRPLTVGMEARWPDLDFDAFESEDINAFSGLYDDVLVKNGLQADGIAKTLRQIAPVCKESAYV